VCDLTYIFGIEPQCSLSFYKIADLDIMIVLYKKACLCQILYKFTLGLLRRNKKKNFTKKTDYLNKNGIIYQAFKKNSLFTMMKACIYYLELCVGLCHKYSSKIFRQSCLTWLIFYITVQ